MRWLDEEWHLSNGMGSISPPNTLINAGYPVVSEAYFAAGWPFRSLHWWADVDNRPLRTGGANIIVYEGGIAWPDWLHGHAGGGSFALKPIWFGFVGDSLFYAALFAAIYFGVRHLVRAIRVYRRLCPTCKYPIGTSPLCTECGEPLPTPRIQ